MQTFTLREVTTTAAKTIRDELAAGRPVAIDIRAYVIPAAWGNNDWPREPMISANGLRAPMLNTLSDAAHIAWTCGNRKQVDGWLVRATPYWKARIEAMQ